MHFATASLWESKLACFGVDRLPIRMKLVQATPCERGVVGSESHIVSSSLHLRALPALLELFLDDSAIFCNIFWHDVVGICKRFCRKSMTPLILDGQIGLTTIAFWWRWLRLCALLRHAHVCHRSWLEYDFRDAGGQARMEGLARRYAFVHAARSVERKLEGAETSD